jgi:hypothetical protein
MWACCRRPCEVCGSPLSLDGMCPMRYLRPHDQLARDRADCIAWCLMVADCRTEATRADWEATWSWVGEPPLSAVPFPG